MTIQQEFIKLHAYLNDKFTSVERALATKADKVDIESLRNAVDGLYGRLDTVEVELSATGAHLQRLEDRITRW